MQVTKRDAVPWRSGWCGTEQHGRCAAVCRQPKGDVQCACLCHNKREAARLAQSERMRAEWAGAK